MSELIAAPPANVDPAELKKFSDLAHRWWDPQGAFRPLHEMNPVRLQWIEAHAPLAGCRVVDVGCGGGILAEAMSARGARVLGIDLAGKSLQVARLHAMDSGATVEYRAVAAEDLAREQPGQFDVVTCMEMLEHVPDPAAQLAELRRLLRPGGELFVSTINRNLRSFALAIVGAEYLMRLLPRGTHSYERLIRPAELGRWARAVGLTLREIRGLAYDPFTRSCRLTRESPVNYIARLEYGGSAER